MNITISYPVVDLFAGPGGLGEGFASLSCPDSHEHVFHTAISIEKDSVAHQTLQLRHFYRLFPWHAVPDEYYAYLAGEITRDTLYALYPRQAAHAAQTAWLCTLGETPHDEVREHVAASIGSRALWVLVGGPPCQAYSHAGRSRMKGMQKYVNDPRHFLYKEYLRILADHQPPVFVMENVKGLISSQVQGEYVIKNILRDLVNPGLAIYGEESGHRYRLFSLVVPGPQDIDADPKSFVVRSEDYGIPQARHRIFILGVRADIPVVPATLTASEMCSLQDVIGDLPRLRSSISRVTDSTELWIAALEGIRNQQWCSNAGTEHLHALAEKVDEVLRDVHADMLPTAASRSSIPRRYQEWFADARLKTLLSHESRGHMPSDLHRYLFAAVYAEVCCNSPRLTHFPQELLPAHRNVQPGQAGYAFNDRFKVQLPHLPATTVTSHISKDGHYFIHYDPRQCRSMTVREAARIQTFPDNYKFEGNRTQQYQQVGNAVPPLLAQQIARIVYTLLQQITPAQLSDGQRSAAHAVSVL